jgi:hypothetical protein
MWTYLRPSSSGKVTRDACDRARQHAQQGDVLSEGLARPWRWWRAIVMSWSCRFEGCCGTKKGQRRHCALRRKGLTSRGCVAFHIPFGLEGCGGIYTRQSRLELRGISNGQRATRKVSAQRGRRQRAIVLQTACSSGDERCCCARVDGGKR